MKKFIALFALSAAMLASCGNGGGNSSAAPTDAEIIERISTKGAAKAMWADSGSTISHSKTNEVAGAHTPVLATKFTTRINGTSYTATLDWGGIDGTDWIKYDYDEEHIVVIAQRQSVGGQTLEATFTPTIKYGSGSMKGDEYKFTCPPYEVAPVEKTAEDLTKSFYADKTVKTKDVLKTTGKVTFMSPDMSTVIIQDGSSAVQLYKASAFSTFFGYDKTISAVGNIKDYYGAEFDPVLDVSPSTKEVEVEKFELTKSNVESFRAEMKDGNKTRANQLCEGQLSVTKVYKNKSGVATTLYLDADGDENFALYTKSGYSGDAGSNAIYELFASCKEGDIVKFKGAMALYNDLVEVNLYSADDVEIVSKAE